MDGDLDCLAPIRIVLDEVFLENTMTTHPGLPVKGYEKQSTSNVDLVNANKEIEERVLRMLDELKELEGVDQRWLATGRTDIEKGFMAVNRSIFKPSRVEIPE